MGHRQRRGRGGHGQRAGRRQGAHLGAEGRQDAGVFALLKAVWTSSADTFVAGISVANLMDLTSGKIGGELDVQGKASNR